MRKSCAIRLGSEAGSSDLSRENNVCLGLMFSSILFLQPVDEFRSAHAGHAFEDWDRFLFPSAEADDIGDLLHCGFELA